MAQWWRHRPPVREVPGSKPHWVSGDKGSGLAPCVGMLSAAYYSLVTWVSTGLLQRVAGLFSVSLTRSHYWTFPTGAAHLCRARFRIVVSVTSFGGGRGRSRLATEYRRVALSPAVEWALLTLLDRSIPMLKRGNLGDTRDFGLYGRCALGFGPPLSNIIHSNNRLCLY